MGIMDTMNMKFYSESGVIAKKFDKTEFLFVYLTVLELKL